MSRFFMKFFVSVFVVLGLATASFAQDEANMARPLTKSGSAAFVFNLGGLGTFGLSAQPISSNITPVVAGIGGKWYIADDMAIKLLLAFATTSNGDTAVATHFTTTTLGIGATFEYHFKPLYATSPYVGAGIKYASYSTTTGTDTKTQLKTSASEFNIGAVAGFDWFFTKGLAIGAEYFLGFTTNSSNSSTGGTDVKPTPPSPSTIALGLVGSGSVHLVVYF